MSKPLLLTVYGREYCHLCHDMVAALEGLRARYPFCLEVVDIEDDASLEERYGVWVPVLVAEGEEICHYFLDQGALEAYFARAMAEQAGIR